MRVSSAEIGGALVMCRAVGAIDAQRGLEPTIPRAKALVVIQARERTRIRLLLVPSLEQLDHHTLDLTSIRFANEELQTTCRSIEVQFVTRLWNL